MDKKGNVLKMRSKKGEDEKFLLKNGSSNQGFHYHGSAKFFAQTGKAFADALAGMKKR